MSNRDFEEWFMKEIADDDGDYNKPVYEAAKWAWQARVPEGYVVVPKEPTERMLDAARRRQWDDLSSPLEDMDMLKYKAMLEAVEK